MHRYCLTFVVASGFAAAAAAQSYQFTLDPNVSTTSIASNVLQELPGTAIGNYDPISNPTGTQTRPGVIGGSGNMPVRMDIAVDGDVALAGAPGGGFVASVDAAAGVILVSGLDVAAIGKDTGTIDVTLVLDFDTFRTFSPNSLYIGGIPLPIPLQQGTVTNARVTQVGPAVPGTLTPTATPDVYDVAVLVPAALTFDIDLFGNQMTVGPAPIALPLAGSLDLGGGKALISLSVDETTSQQIPAPDPPLTIEDIPLDVPTVLPPGSTAHLVLDLAVGDLAFDVASSLEWYASGAAVCATAGYCVTTPNTWGPGATISTNGETSLFFNRFSLVTDGVPPGHPGAYFYGSARKSAPFGDGTMCVGGVTRRMPVVWSDDLGLATFDVDFLDPNHRVDLITAGSTWNFQLAFRDPLGGPATFNTSDAIEVTFCP
jgi:hypothetical protein